MLNCDFLEKGLGIVSPSHFVHDFQKKGSYVVLLYYLCEFHCLIAFTFYEILGICVLQLLVSQVVTS